MDIELKLIEGVTPEDEEIILDRLKEYNVDTFGGSGRRELAVPLYNPDGNLVGGLTGYTGRGWLYISMLYIPEELRGRGLAGRMLEMAETEARSRGCVGAYIDTMNPRALKLYRKQGYSEIGSLNGLTGGHTVTWLEKRF
ncbi:GNAT family N-acetyltransferase [Rhizobium sp. YS-1r]|uniref:GNAT family N-acetyltransferase n=1 Tax=Rhizobium sp. YS-1r TaxID=1532558 RepID=UPI00068D02FF|nr:GNAT family N-acetyltransferase [Rhizobium sp. YS-1r]